MRDESATALTTASPAAGGDSCVVFVDPAADPTELDQSAPDVREVSAPEERAIGARVCSSPQLQGATVVEACSKPLIDGRGDQYTPQLEELALDLRARFARVHSGDLADPEAMLFAQAQALQSLFSHLAAKGLDQISVTTMQNYLSVALKAQARSRATLTALADLRQPRQPNFIGQQNVALNQTGRQLVVAKRFDLANRKPADQTIGGSEWRTVGPSRGG